MNKDKIKKWIEMHPDIVHFILTLENKCPFNNSIHIHKTNKLQCNGLMRSTHIKVHGKDNIIRINNYARLQNCNIIVNGDNNLVEIKEWAYVEDCEIIIEDNNNVVSIGENTTISGKTHLAAIEGTSITIGKDCLFSANITVRTGDSHSILLAGTEERSNPSEDVVISDSVWIGNGATILKGVTIQSYSIVGTQAVVTKSPNEEHCILAGNPARVVKNNIDWRTERIKI